MLVFGLCYFLVWINFVKSIVIDTKLGKIEGIKEGDVSIFKNIPYAEPPINELRWKPTQPLKNPKFNGVYNATVYGNACNQVTAMATLMTGNSTLSEDCLTLNIFTPYNFDKPDKLRKVLFWVHGGGLTVGSANTYNSTKIVEYKDILVVTINYRLGVAGFLVNPELYDNPTGNGGANAFLDMIEALKWVQNNIESYGGDPNEVTIIGESGGGWGVCGLLLSPLARGLFKRTVQMSGSCIESLGTFKSREQGWESAKKVRDSVGAKTFNDLKNMDMQVIIDTFSYTMESLGPSIDGYAFPKGTLELLEDGYINGESVMLGTTIRESFTEKPFNMGKPAQNESDLYAFYNKFLYDTQVNMVKEYYPFNNIDIIYPYGKSEFNDNPATLIQTQIVTDCWVRCGTLKQAKIIRDNELLKNSVDVYFYQYGYYTKPYDEVSHGYDVVGLFGFDALFISGGAKYYDEFTKLTMDFYIDYALGIKPKINNVDATYNNGYFLEINEEIKILSNNELKLLDKRCELYDKLGSNIYQNPFCFGYDFKDVSNYPTPDETDLFDTQNNAAENDKEL